MDDWLRVHADMSVPVSAIRLASDDSPAPTPNADVRFGNGSVQLQVVTRRSEWFPCRLKTKSGAPLLWVAGQVESLGAPSFGLCGSRNASERGIARAEQFGELAAELGARVITGAARGVDTAATRAALDADGTVVNVLAEGIQTTGARRFVSAVASGKVTVVSEFRPAAHWTVGQAMQRNATICALSTAMFVIEAGESGGTLNAGRTALKLGVPLFAIRYKDECAGNEILIREGATPLETLGEVRIAMNELLASPSG